MSNLDLINAYFDNEMSKPERLKFEDRLQHESELKKEFDFQQDIVEGIKHARANELKAMLDKVPVSGTGTSAMGKALSSAALIGAVAFGVYYFWPEDEPISPVATNNTEMTTSEADEEDNNIVTEEVVITKEETANADEKSLEELNTSDPITQEEVNTTETPVVVSEEDIETTVTQEDVVVTEPEINTPDPMAVFDNQENLNDSLEAPGGNLITKPNEDHTTIDVEINNTHKNYSFHYQFKSGRLFLYGSFDKGLYEILEINSGGKTLFLYYKDKFYPLSAKQTRVAPLEPVKESSLIKKLQKAREEG